MNISSLIELAKDAAGSYGELAERIGRPASRISDWKAGRRKPDAADIMLLAEVAGRPVFETLAEIEMELDTERSSVWQRALGNLRAAGVAATVVLGATAVASLTSKPADAAEKAQENKDLARPAGIEPATPAFGGRETVSTAIQQDPEQPHKPLILLDNKYIAVQRDPA
ncbi:Helix-turn-helix domain protein [Burkholderia pseudomallei]|nr:Helix-turn-helix domain protein [Burkholderia pseudomallei]CAJ3379011.1 Helix-turn-helix domain protein [Burkholderia pseudomallei]CAJ3383496.1 Helix-turn-helix domain protein [Burkholderia pseudomallei]CAJ4009436.1 Helix-turn-helix domain protein [Burkholderia pseudomallei]CAJ4017181.1 Helix-turn-helix domain protein [Burkholderia pseudomallei]